MPVMTEPRRFPSSWDIEEHNQSCYIVRTFLGCLNCTKYDAGSVCNKYGEQGVKIPLGLQCAPRAGQFHAAVLTVCRA